jgi:hypothetical protein
MPRNRQYLSEQELFVKTTNMIEYVVDAQIRLVFARGGNFCNFNGYQTRHESKDGALNSYTQNKKIKFFSINIATPPERHIPQYTALLHELAHILYESPFTPMKQLLENWNAPRLYYDIFNILEDQRIESHLARSYIGYKNRFDKVTNDLGKAMKTLATNDPSFILLAIRFHRDDLVRNSKNYKIYKKALEDVIRTDKFGGLRILISIKKYIEEFISEQEGDRYSSNMDDGKTKNRGQSSRKSGNISNNRQPHPKKFSESLNTENPSSKESKIPDQLLGTDYTQNKIDDIIEEGKLEGEKQFQNIREKLLSGYRQDNSPSHIKKIDRLRAGYKVDKVVSKGLKKIFKLLKLRDRPFIDYTGYEVDVNTYIENFIKGTNLNRSYQDSKRDRGASIVISIDASGSMYSQDKIGIARKLVATLFDSIKGIPNVEICGNVWASNSSGDIGITEIKNIQDVQKISLHMNYVLTPTHMGLEYSMQMLKRMRGYNKLIILITDGYPNYQKNNKNVPTQHYLKTCRRSLQKVLKVTPNVLCVNVESGQIAKTLNQRLFGKKRVITVYDMQDASGKIIKEFRKFIVKNVENPF